MKPINLKNLVSAHNALTAAVNRAAYCSQHGTETSKARANEQVEEARVEYISACTPLDKELYMVQTRCSARTIQPSDIIRALDKIERSWGIPKKYMIGCKVSVDINAQSFPNAYHGIPESTKFTAEYKAGSWRITDIRRGHVRSATNAVLATLTDEAKQAILAKYEAAMI